MATVKVWFHVYDVPDNDTGKYSKAINNLVDELSTVNTELTWDDVEWEAV
jgi:hypothetical protein